MKNEPYLAFTKIESVLYQCDINCKSIMTLVKWDGSRCHSDVIYLFVPLQADLTDVINDVGTVAYRLLFLLTSCYIKNKLYSTS